MAYGIKHSHAAAYLPTMPPQASATQQPYMASGQSAPVAANVGGNANMSVAFLVAAALFVMLGFHLLGFRFAFDVSVGRRG